MPHARRHPICRRAWRAVFAPACAVLAFPAGVHARCAASFGGCPAFTLPEPDALLLAGLGLALALLLRRGGPGRK